MKNAYAPQAASRWEAYLLAYQHIPDAELLTLHEVQLELSLAEILSRDGQRVNCICCGEEIINEREVMLDGKPWCRSCAGERYYRIVAEPVGCPQSSQNSEPPPGKKLWRFRNSAR
ncbi:MAG: hypothetical protein Kow0031_41640 [Anaerolineae bacterium]